LCYTKKERTILQLKRYFNYNIAQYLSSGEKENNECAKERL